MSRYELAPSADAGRVARIAIGWDRPLRTFYVQLFGALDDDGEEEVILWAGTAPGELASVAAALALVRPHATVPDDLLARLEADRRDGHDRRDGPAQVAMRPFLSGPGGPGGRSGL